ncbi:hypothetical protein [Prosthecochloris sp. HL-130-GSB]|jgi:hypothetical protein|uniref:hypothetical protein n=1 Tax=Prosthecochloris sp. HL-130-GSB TaxID=1974213 RepID=UPI000A1C0087|nr:hypothetical protein [Prosthecochloris sp. HL-130-GSB]ARM31698.1 hypothetical protein B9H02_10805 [Prosthecochloris sp. HL-130-GSB]MBO8093053.1 hypothetical protein [Prosthecochloris sp.]
MNWTRAIAVWLLIAAAETIHGILRSIVLVPAVGEYISQWIGVCTGSGIILVIAWLTIEWIGARSGYERVATGAVWTILMIIFEFSLGTALGLDPGHLLQAYNPAEGGPMIFGMMLLFASPWIAARIRQRKTIQRQ